MGQGAQQTCLSVKTVCSESWASSWRPRRPGLAREGHWGADGSLGEKWALTLGSSTHSVLELDGVMAVRL